MSSPEQSRIGQAIRKLLPGAILGGCIALVGAWLSWAPFDFDVEERFGLTGLFLMRGARTPPEDVVIIGIDALSSKQAGFSPKPERWPRSLHAELIRKLSRACAKVIVYDIFFPQAGDPEEDLRLAAAIREANNVALVSHLTLAENPLPPTFSAQSVQIQQQPLSLFTEAAAGVAPFLIPNASSAVAGFWLFKSGAGDIPSLPAVAVAIFGRAKGTEVTQSQASRSDSTGQPAPDNLVEAMRRWRGQRNGKSTNSADPIAAALEGTPSGLLNRLYQAAEFQYLNFYGPPRTIKTIDFPSALDLKDQPAACDKTGDFSGKVVMVGMSETSPVEQKDRDTFDTVYTQSDGRKLSGVEIAATAIGNFLEDRPLRRLDIATTLAIVVACGWGLGLIWSGLSASWALVLSASLMAGYLWGVFSSFAHAAVWLPWVVPAGQWGVAGIAGIAMQRRSLHMRLEILRTALAEWLPPRVVTEILNDPAIARRASGLVYGTGMAIQVSDDAMISARQDPLELSQLMSDFFRSMAKAVTRRSGFVSEQTRNSQVSLWVATKPDSMLRREACASAFDIERCFNASLQSCSEHRFTFRIGMHAGSMAVDAAHTHGAPVSRGFGTVIDTAESIAQLNVALGTRVLVSQDACAGIAGMHSRPLGGFAFSGTLHPVEIAELLGFINSPQDEEGRLCAAFRDALDAYKQGDWYGCIEELLNILEQFPEDGPSLFYLKRCEFFKRHPPLGAWDPVIRL